MPSPVAPLSCHEFYFPDVDTLIQVEQSASAIIIRASRNTFGEQRKRRFIHALAAEGFIPDECEWWSLSPAGFSGGIRWLVDVSWLRLDPAVTAKARRFMARLITGAVLLWLVLMTTLLLHSAR